MNPVANTIEYLVPEKISVIELSQILKKKSLQMHVSYGSGGFYCSLVANNGKHFVGYSYDIVDSIRKALVSFDHYMTEERSFREEEVTRPDFTLDDVASGRVK